MTDDFNPTRLACSHGPDLHFDGKLLGSYSTQNKAGSKSRWTELRLWETPAGNWIAESVGCSTRENEGEIREARVIGSAARRCPFCDNSWDAPEESVFYAGSEQAVLCGRCSARGPDAATEEEAVRLWNGPEHERRQAAMEAWGWTSAAKALARELGWNVVRRVD